MENSMTIRTKLLIATLSIATVGSVVQAMDNQAMDSATYISCLKAEFERNRERVCSKPPTQKEKNNLSFENEQIQRNLLFNDDLPPLQVVQLNQKFAENNARINYSPLTPRENFELGSRQVRISQILFDLLDPRNLQ